MARPPDHRIGAVLGSPTLLLASQDSGSLSVAASAVEVVVELVALQCQFERETTSTQLPFFVIVSMMCRVPEMSFASWR